jgi:hypothetical protein
MPLGKIVAICWLSRCVEITPEFSRLLSEQEIAFGDYTPGRYAWILDNIQCLPEPVWCPGHQGLWEWSGRILGPYPDMVKEVVKAVERAMPEDHYYDLWRK